jgi:hypothetical protein
MSKKIESPEQRQQREQGEARQWIAAAKIGDIAALESMEASGLRVGSSDEDGDTALMYAAAYGQLEALEWLLKAGSSMDIRNAMGTTALMDAAMSGEWRCVKALADAGCDMDCGDAYEETALMFAVDSMDRGDEDGMKCISVLLAAGCGLDARDEHGMTSEERARAVGAFDEAAMMAAERERRALCDSVKNTAEKSSGMRI